MRRKRRELLKWVRSGLGIVPGVWYRCRDHVCKVRLVRVGWRVWVLGEPAGWFRGDMIGTFMWPSYERLSHEQRREFVVKFLRRLDQAEMGKIKGRPLADADFAKTYPALHEWWTSPAYPDGSPRKTGTLVFFIDNGSVKCFFTDKEVELQLCVTSDTFEGALQLLEEALEADVQPWRPCKPAPGVQDAFQGKKGGHRGR